MTTRMLLRISLAGLFIAATLLAAIGIAAEDTPPPDPAPGELLIASAAIGDPRFHHAVILILRHDAAGAFGIAINRPLGERPIAALLADAGDSDSADRAIEGTIRVFLGGPVEPQH